MAELMFWYYLQSWFCVLKSKLFPFEPFSHHAQLKEDVHVEVKEINGKVHIIVPVCTHNNTERIMNYEQVCEEYESRKQSHESEEDYVVVGINF